MQPKVAIVIPSYNSKQFLEETVNSAKNQVYENCDIYIYDNESTDGSYEIARALEESDGRIKVFQVENIYERSYREAFEHSFENLDFDYITFLASDDYLDPSYISSYIGIFSKKPERIKCIQSPICGVQNGVKTGYISHAYNSLGEFKQQCLVRSPVTTPSVMYHKSVYQYLLPKSHIDNSVQFGGAEDYDMFCNLVDNGIFIYSVPKFMGYYYRWHENQSTWKVHKQEIDYDKMIKDYWQSKWS
jgi:glycosyltransferase involved in cell wall biosynthesis